MRVDGGSRPPRGRKASASGSCIEQVLDEFLEEKTAALRCSRRPGRIQFAVILGEHRVAGRFQENNRRVVAADAEQREIVASEIRGLVEMALAEGGPAAAFALLQQS